MKKITCFILAFIILSCTKEERSIEWIDIANNLNNHKLVPLSTIAENIEYIKLETNKNCYIGRILNPQRDIIFHKNLIYLKDNNKLFCFDEQGNFIRSYNAHGKGPGEWTDIRNFAICHESGHIVIHSAHSQNALLYSPDGSFLKNHKIDFWPTGFTVFNKKMIFFNCKGRRQLSGYYTMTILNMEGVHINRLLYQQNEYVIEKKEALGLFAEDGIYYKYFDTLSYWEYQYDTVWRVSDEFNIIPRYYINYGKDKIPFKYLLKSNARKENEINKYIKLTHLIETNNLFFLQLNNKGKLNRIIYDKRNKKVQGLKYKEKNQHSTRFAFFNDIDKGISFWPQGVISENIVYQLVHPNQIKDHVNKFPDLFNEPLSPLEKRFVELSNITDLNDNPIIMVVELKTEL